MCGIFALLSKDNLTQEEITYYNNYADKCKHRGPDMTSHTSISDNVLFTFHRLCIVDRSDKGMQPFNYAESHSICNGEIYNHQSLRDKYDYSLTSGSDCEVIIPTIEKLGLSEACKSFDGVFSFVVHNKLGEVLVGRDPFGVRSLYIGRHDNGNMIFASEMKCIPEDYQVSQFPPGSYAKLSKTESGWKESELGRYYHYNYPLNEDNVTIDSPQPEIDEVVSNIRSKLEAAVDKRMMSDRPIGCLLSGGLDSSIIVGILSERFKTLGKRLRTFSVGLEGSVDLQYAKLLSEYLNTDHTELVVTEEEMLGKLEDDIYHIESYDTTTIRASTPMYILCKYIKENTDITVIFSGEGSDEASGSYMYFHNAPDKDSFKKETERLMEDLHNFDVLRCDKSSASVGLEIRVPFLDKEFLGFYMGLDPTLKIPNGNIEKRLLRLAFQDILPDKITWRVKEGMSDGVSSMKRSWYSIIQDKVESLYTQDDLDKVKDGFNPPLFKEALYFRDLFNKHYKGRERVIPHYWLPRWSGDVVEPSARVLNVYNHE